MKVRWVPVSDAGDAPSPLARRQALLDTARPLDKLDAQERVRALAELARKVAGALDS